MSKIFLIGDVHLSLGYPNDVNKWYKVHVEYFDKFLIPFLKKEVKEGDIIVQMGDLFDNRSIIPIDLLNYGMNIIEQISSIAPFHILIGNHDCFHKSGCDINTINPFKYMPNVFVYDTTTVVNYNKVKICFMPYVENRDEQISLLKEYSGCEYLFCHSDLNGCRMHLTSVAHRNTNKIEIGEFSGYKVVKSGHIHITQDVGNFAFIGNIFEMDRKDIDNKKGITILDTKDYTERFVENTISPKFKKITIDKEEDIDLIPSVNVKDWVDLYISNSLLVNNRKLKRKLEAALETNSFNSINYIDDIVQEKVDIIELNESLSINLDFTEYISNYIDAQKYDTDKIRNGIKMEYDNIISIHNESNK